MDEIEIIHIPCENYDERQARLIEVLLELAKTLNVEPETGNSVPDPQEAA